jgi:hypothetical protein
LVVSVSMFITNPWIGDEKIWKRKQKRMF